MSHWMFRCRDVTKKVSRSMDTPLPLGQRMAVGIHLMMCRYCSRFRRQLVMLRKLSRIIEVTDLPADEPSEKLSEETRERIKGKIRPFL